MHPHRNRWLVHVVVRPQLWMILREDGNGRRSQRLLPAGRSFVRFAMEMFESKVLDAVVEPVEVEDHL